MAKIITQEEKTKRKSLVLASVFELKRFYEIPKRSELRFATGFADNVIYDTLMQLTAEGYIELPPAPRILTEKANRLSFIYKQTQLKQHNKDVGRIEKIKYFAKIYQEEIF